MVLVAAVVSLGSCARVQEACGVVSERELRLCVLTLIGHGRARTAELLNYSPSGIGKLKDMTAKKMGSTGKDLHDFLLKMVLDA